MRFNVHAGHNFHVPGAGGQFSETREDRNVKDKLIALLRAEGHTVYDCTDEDGRSQNANLANIVRKCNAHSVDLDVSIHFNAFDGSAHGVEVCVPNGSSQTARAARICSKIAALGYSNRGVKYRNNLYVLNRTKAPALLVECCFCDSRVDSKLYDADKMARAIAEGILGKTIGAGKSKTYRVVVDTDVLNVRAKASKDSDIIAKMEKGDKITVVAETDNWVQRKHGGWVARKYVKKI